uniref:Glucose-methanol-choline oxidoreductase N-terminal domain-containing protein n=1 Tax=Romanomermis culicivorax TaxID=13658 RepID=A0A915K024_ROMCU
MLTSIRRYSSRAAFSRPRNDFDNDSLNVIYRRRLKTKNLINIQHRRLASPFSLGAAKLPDIDANFHFTHVIIGAGSAGCVMANRLTENPEHKVLLIEAGPRDDWWRWKIHMPSALMYNLSNDNYNWYYHTLPEVHMNERVMYCPRGRVWGGSSALNAMVYVRGHAKDYDRWAFKEGAQGWSYADCLPYFKKSENFDKGADDYRGGSGPLHVHRFDGKHNPLYAAFVEAGKQAGYGFTEDMNGFKQEGVGYMDATIYKGKRWSAAQAYLRPILKRPNFFYECNSLVTKLIFDKHRAVGVETVRNVRNAEPSRRRHYCESDVILCGGAINSPQILMLSGIGHEAVLKAADVPVRLHLPGVGQNLQDHLELYVQQRCSQPVTLYDKSTLRYPHKMAAIGLQWLFTRQGLGATGHLEAGGFVRSETEDEHPNIQFHFLPSMVVDHGRKDPSFHGFQVKKTKRKFVDGSPIFQVHVGPMRPTSRGFVKITTKNPFDHPAIVFNYMSTDFDRLEMRQSIKAARKIFQQKAFDEYRAGEVQPGVDLENDSDLDDFVRENADSAYHPSCTCKMGPVSDPCSVVDPLTMIVHGTDNLRIVDSSVMPSVVSGNLNAPVMMMAEKAADMIQNKPLLAKAENIPVFSHKK